MKPSKKWFKRSIIPVVALAVLGTYLALPSSVQAEEKVLGQVDYSSVVLEGSYSAYSNNRIQNYTTVDVVPDAGKTVTKVILRNKATKEFVRDLPKASGNAYTLGEIEGEVIPVAYQVADTWDGTWNWWRDSTNPKVWMYDLDDRYYFLQDGVYDQPQLNAKKKVLPQPSDNNAPLPSFEGAEEVSDGNIGWARSTKTLPSTVSGDGQIFDVRKLTNIKASYEYYYDPSSELKYISPSNILAVETETEDLPNLQITFRYKARFSEVYVSTPFGSQGIINEYHTKWKVSLSTEVYKYPQLEIVYYQEPAGGGSPSPGASSTPTSTPTPTPDKEKIVAQFEIEEPVIEYGEYNWAKPIGSSVTGGGQKLKEYVWTISQNGNTETETSNAVLTMGGFPSFPRWLTTGTVSVSLKVVSTSGNSASAGPKTFQIITPASCTSYNPKLDFNVGFVDHGNRGAWQAINTAVIGDYLDVQELAPRPDDEPPPSGSYPKTILTWDWKNAIKSSAWLKKYYDNYQPYDQEEYYSFPYSMALTNADLGSHSIKATKTDACGNSNSRSASVTVVPPNPVAVIRGPATVKEARPLKEPFDSSFSYSPVRGRTINHSRDEWGNKQTVYYTPGTETITLKVWDTAGLPSLNTTTHTLIVLPDEPPIALLKTQSKAIRGADTMLKDASYSPDRDTIKFVELFVKYDSNNNGSFDDEAETQLFFDSSGKLNHQYDRVGKYRFRIRAVEDSPLNKENTSYFEAEVVNDTPWVSFEMASTVQEPMVIPTIPVSMDPANWNATSLYDETAKKNWRAEADGSMSTYPYITSSVFGQPQVNGSYRTADPYASELVTTVPLNESSGNGDSSSKTTYVVDGLGYIFTYNNYCRDCGNQYDYGASIITLDGKTAPLDGDPILYDINPVADEITFLQDYGYFTYKLSSMFNLYVAGSTYTPPYVRYGVHSILLRQYGYNAPPLSGFMKRDFRTWSGVPAAISGLSGFSKNENDYNLSLGILDGAGPSSDRSKIKFNSMTVYKNSASGSLLWSKILNVGNDRVSPSRVLYNLDESKIYVIGKLMRANTDSEGDTYWTYLSSVYLKVLDAVTGNELASTTLTDNSLLSHGSGAVFGTYLGNLIVIEGSIGLRVYNDQLQVLKTDSRVPSGSTLTGDGFVRTITGGSSYGFLLYDLKTFEFISSGSNLNKLPVSITDQYNGGVTTYTVGATSSSGEYESGGSWSDVSVTLAGVRNVPFANRPLASHSQLVNPALPSIKDLNLTFKYKYTDDNLLSYNVSGMSFKIQDRRNMYRVEFGTKSISMVKIIDGARTVLHSESYEFNKGTYYSFRIKSYDNKHTVYVNGVPLFDVTDNTFQAGSFGPSTDLYNVYFKDLAYQDLSAASGSSLTKDTVIVDQEIQYALTFEDTENDPHPIDLTWWQFQQTNPWKFLDAGDGKTGWSAMNGATQHGSLPSLDRVGFWKVTHWLKDDPHPDYPYPSEVFGGYREESNRYSRNIIVHRRPVALFTLWLNGDGTVGWNEQSYDPDRWLSAWNYSTESPVYATNRGIYARKYKYITPSGLELEGKLLRPSESGVYTVSEAVMDEYGAWSDWYNQQITATIILPPNKVPVVDFESPRYVYRDDLIQLVNKSVDPDGDAMTYNWNIMKPPYTSWLSNAQHPSFRIVDRGLGKDAVSPNWFITLEATDSKGETGSKTKPLKVLNHVPTTTIHGKEEVLIRQTHSYQSGGADQDSEDNNHLSYYWKVTAPDGTEASYSSSTISLTFSQGGTYKLEHWVVDPVGDSSNIAQLLVSVDDNKPPVPGFTITSNPAYRGEAVGIVSTASDPDGIIARHDYWITGPDGLDQHVTTEADWSRTYSVLGDYTIRQRVEDNKGALAETSQVLHIINRPPTVELTTPSGSDAEHPSVNIPPFKAEWTYQDEDGDPQASYTFAIYEYPSGTWKTGTTGTGTASHFNVPTGILQGGVTYYATVTVSDGYDTTTSQPKYFILNRPPVADFIWSPSPVYEGDTVKLTNKSYDPDGDLFTSRWTVKTPDGNAKSYDTTDVSVRWTQVGSYTVTLTVTDSYGDSDTVTKTIQVLPLGISGFVGHTETWNNNRAKFNAKQEREETGIHRNDDEFWAGEAFILTADTTNTGTATYAVSVDVIAEGDPIPHDWAWYHLHTEMEPEDGRVKWKGRMNSPDPDRGIKMEQLSDGPLDFTFEVTYSNGTVKQDVVRIYMRNKWTEYWQIHRAW